MLHLAISCSSYVVFFLAKTLMPTQQAAWRKQEQTHQLLPFRQTPGSPTLKTTHPPAPSPASPTGPLSSASTPRESLRSWRDSQPYPGSR